MKVRELLERLRDCSPDAEVRIMTQPSWPFENSISGVVERREFSDPGAELAEHCTAEHCTLDDVFILEGRQLRYGSKKAWEV